MEKCSSMAQQLYSTSGNGWARYPLTRFDTSTWIPGSNRQAVDRLDESVENPKMEGQSATICNQALAGHVGE